MHVRKSLSACRHSPAGDDRSRRCELDWTILMLVDPWARFIGGPIYPQLLLGGEVPLGCELTGDPEAIHRGPPGGPRLATRLRLGSRIRRQGHPRPAPSGITGTAMRCYRGADSSVMPGIDS